MTDKEISDMEAIMSEGPEVEIEGRIFKLRRLGVRDTFKLARIVAIGAAGIGKEIGNMQELSPELIGGLLLLGFPYAERDVLEFLSSIIDVPFEEFSNPEKFPMGSEVVIVNALVEHVDVKAFFSKIAMLTKSPAFKTLLKGTSTSSKKGTAGQTKKS
jgi:hypothetical protein